MAARVVLTARCRKHRHRLAWVTATPSGLVLTIPHQTVAIRGRPGEIRSSTHGPKYEELFDPSLTVGAVCACGTEHLVAGRKLQRALDNGEATIILDPVR